MKDIFFLFILFVFTSCSTQTRLSSIDFDACFMSYKDSSELGNALEEMNQTISATENPSTSTITVVGCLNYQLGNYGLAETWLQRAFAESKEDKTKSIAASALSLIYLKEFSKQKITKPYLASAEKHYLGRWMLILYYLDLYKETGVSDYLLSAISTIELKHQQEGGGTSATERFQNHMKLINAMEETCGSHSAPESDLCSEENLDDEKLYLFSTARGFLLMLLKEKPFNNI